MSKSGKGGSGRTSTTPAAASRVQSVVAQNHQGAVPKGSVASRMATAAAKNYGKSGGKTPTTSES